jgi:hypothetical protein
MLSSSGVLRLMPARKPARKGRQKADPPAVSSIDLKDPRTGKVKRIPVGFAWDLFLFSGLFGLPLFLRRLPQWGAAILALWILDLFLGWLAFGDVAAAAQVALFTIFLVVQLWLGLKGNELTARAYVAHGWMVVHPEFVAIRRLVERWSLG